MGARLRAERQPMILLPAIDLKGGACVRLVRGEMASATQRAAISLYEGLNYKRWGTHPDYAWVDGQAVPGHYYYKRLVGND